MTTYLRFRNLVDRGLFKNRQELRRLQETQGFPRGRLLGPNTRIWTEEEINTYVASRPVQMPQVNYAVLPGLNTSASRLRLPQKLTQKRRADRRSP
jgi:predicted DNA-binding transcriptional regulator AlpA